MNTILRRAVPALFVCFGLLHGGAAAQVSRNSNKSSNPYRGTYQRMANSANSNASFEIRNGVLWAWGSNSNGQLGDGTTTDKATPIQIGIDIKWISVAAGGAHTMGLKSDGTLWAWGFNNYGQLGDGTVTDKTIPTQIGADTKWVSVSAGMFHTLALKSDGTLWAWGYNGFGGLGDGTNTDKATPTQIGADTKWVSISAGFYHTIAGKSDGTIWGWGYNQDGELGDGTQTNKTTPTQISTDNEWTSITGGGLHTVALKSDGTLWAWGSNSNGQLGDGTTSSKITPAQIGTDTKWVSVSAGMFHTMALKSDGTLWAWGNNIYGQLGNGTSTDKTIPTQIGADTKWVGIAAGLHHTLALKCDGTLWAWGRNSNGQLGNGFPFGTVNSPISIQRAPKLWLMVSSGIGFTTALRSDGTIWSLGDNASGQLGDATFTNKGTAVQLGTDTRWVSINAGLEHTLGLKSDGTLWAWGNNAYGQLGNGTNTNSAAQVQIGSDNDWVSFTAGNSFNLAIKSNGTLWAWGFNNFGSLGIGTNSAAYAPVQVGGDNNWVSVSAGNIHTLAIKSDGSLWAWGNNGDGQLGDGTNVSKNAPVRIGTDTKWVKLATGYAHTLAIKSDGTLWGWGSNASGETGLGSTGGASVITPTQVGTDTKWVNVQTGAFHSLAVKSDGSLWGWGFNGEGEVGDGTTVSRLTPTQISGQSNVIFPGGGSTPRHAAIIKADRSSICLTGFNNNGQLGNGTSTNSLAYSCSNSICATFTPASANTVYTNRPLAGVGNRTDFQLNCSIAASVMPSGANPVNGSATGKVFIDGSVQNFNGTAYVQRHYDIEPTTSPNTATATVTLYYTQAEFTAFNAAPNHSLNLPTDATDAANNKANLRITQLHGVPSGGNNPGNYPATWGGAGPARVLIIPTSVTWDADNSWWAVTFPVTGFSGFFVSTNISSPLPVKLLRCTAQKAGSENRIDWATATEEAGTIFTITRSGNGSSFETLGTVTGKGSNSDYNFYDEQPLASVNYYRLKITETNGEVSYSNIAILRNALQCGSITIVPVPAKSTVTITSTDATLNGQPAAVYSMDGRLIAQFILQSSNNIDISNWAAGVYTLKLPGGEAVRVVKE